MIRQYRTNLNCGSCVASVTPFLNGQPGIASWKVDTSIPEKILTIDGTATPEAIKQQVESAGFQFLGEVKNPQPISSLPMVSSQPTTSAEPPRSFKPLIVILAYLLVVITALQIYHGSFHAMMAMNHFMAGFFLIFSFFKMLDIRAFADSYRMYDLLATRWYFWGLLYPFVELALGLAYLVEFAPFTTNAVTLAVMLLGTLGVLASLRSKRKIRCACLGTVFNLPMTWVTLIEDGLMAAMAAGMLLLLKA